jgi:uncharacterized membrane protein YebE (DUF533 family)
MRRLTEKWDRMIDETRLELEEGAVVTDGIMDEGERMLREVGRKAQAAAKPETADEPAKVRTLEAMPEEVRSLYVQVLAAQCLVDGEPHPKEVADIYVFMSKIGLGPDSREEVRGSLAAGQTQLPRLVDLVRKVVSGVEEDEKDVVAFSIVKDMTWISRADGAISSSERNSIRDVAEALGLQSEEVMGLADKVIEYDEAIAKGDVTASELEKAAKEIAAVATAVSVPITALFFSGSVVGLSAAGITSGLAAVGLGGLLGFSAMITGIGVLVVAGVVAYLGVQWMTGGKERELAKKREHMVQEILKLHQEAIEALAEDVSRIAEKLAEYVSKSDRNEERLIRLTSELQTFRFALGTLKDKKEQYVA